MKYLIFIFLLVSTSVFAEDLRTPVTLPACDSGNPEVVIIETAAQFSQVNDIDKRIFCVKAGNYSGEFNITVDGTEGNPRYLIPVDTSLHPVHKAEADRVVVERVTFKGVRHWVSSGITVRNENPIPIVKMQRKIENPGFRFDNNNILLDKFLVEGGGNGAGAVAMGGHDLTVQDFVIRNTAIDTEDDHCLVIYGKRNKVVHNEIYNCAGDGIVGSRALSYNGVVAYNEIYVTQDFHTDGNGNFDPNGEFLCAENAFDIQGGGGSQNRMLIKGNWSYGFDKWRDTNCVGSGGGDITFILHFNARYIDVEDNIVENTRVGFMSANPTVRDTNFVGNKVINADIGFEFGSNNAFGNSFVDNKAHNVNQFWKVPVSADPVTGNGDLVGQLCIIKEHITNPHEVCFNPETVPTPNPIPDPTPDPEPEATSCANFSCLDVKLLTLIVFKTFYPRIIISNNFFL